MPVRVAHQAPKTRPVKFCVFGCGGRAVSLEHAWPAWTLALLGIDGIAGEVDGVAFHEPERKNLTVRCVCEGCNNGWMKRLEDRVIPIAGPMMLGETVSLTRDDRAALGVWAVKTAMVFEFTSREQPLFYTDNERLGVRTGHRPPTNTAVLLARATDVQSFFTRGNGANGLLNGHPAETYISTIAYRSLVVQVFTVRTQARRVGLNGNHVDWSGCFERLSPKGPAFWPPARPIPPGTLDAFHRRFLPEGVS